MLVLTFSVCFFITSLGHVRSFSLNRKESQSCRISLNKHMPKLQPLVINGSKQLLYPNDDDTIVMESNALFTLYCQSSFSNRKIQKNSIQVRCKSWDTVAYNGIDYGFSQMGCSRDPNPTIKRVVGSCAGNHSLINIGYEYTHPEALDLDAEGIDEGQDVNEGEADVGQDADEEKVDEGQDEDKENADEENTDEGLIEIEEVRGTANLEITREEGVTGPKIAQVSKDSTLESAEAENVLNPVFSKIELERVARFMNPTSGNHEAISSAASSGKPDKLIGDRTQNNSEIPKKALTFPGSAKFTKIRNQGSPVEFIKLIQVCYDFERHTTIYSLHSLDERIRGHQKNVKRPSFKPDIFTDENINVDFLYSKKGQIQTLTKLLGSEELANKYIQKDDHFLSRGHYSPKADFIFGSEQTATFYYINAAPQWQTFNGGNWVYLENSVRDLTMNEQAKVTVYTGTYGVTTLKDINDNDIEIYLGEKNGRQIIPVPKYYWKVIYNPDKTEGIAVVGINNPYLEVSEADILCEDICHAYSWIDWDLKNQKRGYMYCCILAEFQQKFINLGL